MDGEIADAAFEGLADVFLPATYREDVETQDPTTGTTTTATTNHPCLAIVQEDEDQFKEAELVERKYRIFLLLARSIDVAPAPGNRLTFAGVDYTINSVGSDPATATYVLQVEQAHGARSA